LSSVSGVSSSGVSSCTLLGDLSPYGELGAKGSLECGHMKRFISCENADGSNTKAHDKRIQVHRCDNWRCPVCGPTHLASKRGSKVAERFTKAHKTFRSELGIVENTGLPYTDWALKFGFGSKYVNSKNFNVVHGMLSFPAEYHDLDYNGFMSLAKSFFKDNGFAVGGLLVFHLWRLSGFARYEFKKACIGGRWSKGQGGIWDFVRSDLFPGRLADNLVFGPHVHYVGFGYIMRKKHWGKGRGEDRDMNFYDAFLWKRRGILAEESDIARCVSYCLNHAAVPLSEERFNPETLEVKRSNLSAYRWFGAMHNRVTCLISEVTEREQEVCQCGGDMLEHFSEDLSLLVDLNGVVDWGRVHNMRECGRYVFAQIPIVVRCYDMRVSLVKGGYSPH